MQTFTVYLQPYTLHRTPTPRNHNEHIMSYPILFRRSQYNLHTLLVAVFVIVLAEL